MSMQVRTFAVLLGVAVLGVLYTPRSVEGATVVVGDPATCPGAKVTTIQAGVNAATPGETIRVCPGTYVEQVIINKAVDLEAENGAILMPSQMQGNATSLVDASPIATAILVTDATGVAISGLVVDGTNSGISECSPVLMGILYQNASGTVDHVTVRNFKLNGAALNGCQSGLAIFVQSGEGGSSNVTVENSTVHDFQKNGITANEVGTSATIIRNVVTGLGPTMGAAQNGIQVGFGAGGSISSNTVTNTIWSPCTAVSTCEAVATNILVDQSDGVQITENVAGINNVGIFVAANQADIERNRTFATSVFDGIHVEGNQGTVDNNDIFNGAESGIFISGNNNVVEHNTITEAAVGILLASGSSGDLVQDNRFFGTAVEVQDPSVPKLSKIISPVR
jgi:parallel beta-helix repeat protein